MKLSYSGNKKKFNVYQNKRKIGSLSKKNKTIEVNPGEIVIKEVITGIAIIDFFLYGIIGFIDVFSNYVDEENLEDCNILLITAQINNTEDTELDHFGMAKGSKINLKKSVLVTSFIFYTLFEIALIVLGIFLGFGKGKAICALIVLINLITFICYFYIMVYLIVGYRKYKKFLTERMGDING